MSPITARLKQSKILVVGDLILDRYWLGQSTRISPEAPVPVVGIEEVKDKLGGAGNVAANVASLGCFVSLLGYVGDDVEADSLEVLLEQSEIHSAVVRRPDLKTIVKLRVMSQGQQLVRLDFEEPITSHSNKDLKIAFNRIVEQHDLVIFSDYRKGALNNLEQLIEIAKRLGKVVIVDPKGINFARYSNSDLITPNLREFENVVGKCDEESDISSKALDLINRYDIQNVLVTRGALGMSLVTKGGLSFHIPAEAEDVYDVTGAGDTVCGVMGAMLSVGLPIEEAMEIANQAAGLVVRKLGAATVHLEELFAAGSNFHFQEKYVSLETLKRECEGVRSKSGKIVLTNGCFDVLHAGHVKYLSEAKKLGDRLVVALNSDSSARSLKGDGRPINCLEDRVSVLAAIFSVDWIVAFEEPTPMNVIKELLPEVLVKGGDYEPSEIVGFKEVVENGGEVRSLEYFENRSTTSIIKQIEKL